MLIDKKNNDAMRHFGLHLLEHVISKTNDRRALSEISNLLLRYASEGVKPFFEEASLVKEKVAALIVAIIKREWPQSMPSLVDNVMQLAALGDVQCEISILTIRTLVCFEIEFVELIKLGPRRFKRIFIRYGC